MGSLHTFHDLLIVVIPSFVTLGGNEHPIAGSISFASAGVMSDVSGV